MLKMQISPKLSEASLSVCCVSVRSSFNTTRLQLRLWMEAQLVHSPLYTPCLSLFFFFFLSLSLTPLPSSPLFKLVVYWLRIQI